MNAINSNVANASDLNAARAKALWELEQKLSENLRRGFAPSATEVEQLQRLLAKTGGGAAMIKSLGYTDEQAADIMTKPNTYRALLLQALKNKVKQNRFRGTVENIKRH